MPSDLVSDHLRVSRRKRRRDVQVDLVEQRPQETQRLREARVREQRRRLRAGSAAGAHHREVTLVIAAQRLADFGLAVSTSARPARFGMPNRLVSPPRRRSQSTSATRASRARAAVSARLAAVTDTPSPRTELVTAMTAPPAMDEAICGGLALYGLTANKLVAPVGHALLGRRETKSASAATVAETASTGLSDESYYKSLDTFYNLRQSALNGSAKRAIDGISTLSPLGGIAGAGLDASVGSPDAPSLWPVMGPSTSSFGQRVDPVLHNGEGEFHAGVDISAPSSTPVRGAADGCVEGPALANGYGREVILDHGNSLESCYAHLSGFAVMEGEHVVRGQVIGYVGTSGRIVGGANLHYEVRIHNTPVNPHKYLRETLAGLGGDGLTAAGS